MSVSCPECGAVAGYGHELAHKMNCPALAAPSFTGLAQGPVSAPEAIEITVSPLAYNEIRRALVARGIGGTILERPLPRRIEMTGVTLVEDASSATDWPPQGSAIGLPDGHRRHGSTGQLFQVQNGQWLRVIDLPHPESDADFRERILLHPRARGCSVDLHQHIQTATGKELDEVGLGFSLRRTP